MAITKEEHARNQRRRARQLLGAVMALLILIGIVTVVRFGVGQVVGLFDQTDEYAAYADRLEGFVMFDPVPFDGIENMDDTTLREAAVWGTIYNILDTENGLDAYSRDPETDMLLLPSVEVDAYLARVLGPSFKLDHRSFEMEDMTIEYDSASQCYKIPVTSSVGYYTPVVTDMFKKGGQLYVTVGYVPVVDEFDITTNTTDTSQPTKYMDYIFSRTYGNWFLTGLTESETVAETTPTASPVPANSSNLPASDVESAIIAGVTGEDGVASSSAASTAADSAADSASADADSAAASSEAASSEADSAA